MDLDLCKNEMNRFGVTFLGEVISKKQCNLVIKEVLKYQKQQTERFGEKYLLKNEAYETLWSLPDYGGVFYDILELDKINTFIDNVLNDKAIVHSYNCIITEPNKKSNMVGYNWHRDQAFFHNTRTSVLIMIPLIDIHKNNGATEFIKGSHLFKEMPSTKFLDNNSVVAECKAGHGFAIDATTFHKAGINSSNKIRPMIVIRYTLAIFKQQIDYTKSAQYKLINSSELLKSRLGWNVRGCENVEEWLTPKKERKFKSGQYDMTNTYIFD